GRVDALSDLSLGVPTGTIYGFLGPNGAGKTTTIRMLLGFVRPSAGSAHLLGHDCWRDGVAARSRVGYLVTGDALYPDMTGSALLDFAGDLSGQPSSLRRHLLDALELAGAALDRRLGAYSKGMRQKLALVAAMQHDPELLILDEPTDGLDPLIQRSFEEVVRSLRARGRTVFMSSHDLPEVERLCERVAIVRDGRLLTEATIADLQRRHRREAVVVFRGSPGGDLGTVAGVVSCRIDGNRASLTIEGEIGPLLRMLAAFDVVDLLLPPPRLEDIFLGFYGSEGISSPDGRPPSPPPLLPLPAESSVPSTAVGVVR
ncbi:MAG: ABC transporter ATP-binding protein, partial [Chloroflexia bacterium]|nr:ABC transporter ATP-binding protein [Chloroflexia bacterium]